MTQMTQIFNFFNPINLGNLWLKVFLPKMQEVVWVDTNLSPTPYFQEKAYD
jgi:hypothetical protein